MTSKTNMYKRIKDLEQTNKLLSDITYRYKKNMYNIGFDIQKYAKVREGEQ
jgi:hypothetical protein